MERGDRQDEAGMSELVLHHYGTSPFSEKVRLVLGMKRLDVALGDGAEDAAQARRRRADRRLPAHAVPADRRRHLLRLAPDVPRHRSSRARAAALPARERGPGRGRRPMGRLDVLLDGGAVHDAGRRGGHLRRRAARLPEGVRRRSRGDDAVAAARSAARRRRRARRVPAADRGDARRRSALPARQRGVDRRLLGSAVDLVHAPRRGERRRCSAPTPPSAPGSRA